MDLSQLPKLSGRKPDAQPASASAEPQPADVPEAHAVSASAPPVGLGVGEVWLSLFVGLVLMFIGQEFARWLIATIMGRTYDTGVEWITPDKSGQMVPYWQLQGHAALSDSAIFLFGFAMIAEGVLLGFTRLMPARWRALVMTSLVIAVVVTLYNAVVLLVMLSDGYTPLAPLLAVGFGGWMVMTQASLLRVKG